MPEHLSLDQSGRLSPETAAGEQWLSGREGRWRIVESAPDLLIMHRDLAGTGAGGVRAVLTGDLQGLPLGELLAFLAQSRWTGVLKVVSASIEKAIFVKQGSMKWALSNLPSDRLGEVLQRLGLVEPEEVERALASAGSGERRIGQLLLEKGLIDASSLYGAIKHQVEEIFFSSLLLDKGLFFLFNDPVEERFAAQLSIDLNGLLMDGLRRIDEISHFKKRIPGPHCYLSRLKQDESGLTDLEVRALRAIGGQTTVADVAAALHVSEFEAIKALFGLAEAGYMAVTEEPPASALGAAGERLTAEVHDVARVFNAIFREIFTEVAEVAPTTGYRLGADSFISSGQHGYPDILLGLAIDEEGKLPEDDLVSRATEVPPDRAPDPAKYLCAALNQVMFFTLFQASEILSPEREEALSRRVESVYQTLES